MSTGVRTVCGQVGCYHGVSWWSTGNHILASLCPQVYGLYYVKLAVTMVLAGGVQVIIF